MIMERVFSHQNKEKIKNAENEFEHAQRNRLISLLVLRAGYGIGLYQFLIIAYLFTLQILKF